MNFSNLNLVTTFGALYQGNQGQANNVAATRGSMNDTSRHMRRAYAADLAKQQYMPKISKHSRTPSAARPPLKRHTTSKGDLNAIMNSWGEIGSPSVSPSVAAQDNDIANVPPCTSGTQPPLVPAATHHANDVGNIMQSIPAGIFRPIRPAPPRAEGVREAPPMSYNIPAVPAPSLGRSEPRPSLIAPGNAMAYMPPYIGNDKSPLVYDMALHTDDAGNMMPNTLATQGEAFPSSSPLQTSGEGLQTRLPLPHHIPSTQPSASGMLPLPSATPELQSRTTASGVESSGEGDIDTLVLLAYLENPNDEITPEMDKLLASVLDDTQVPQVQTETIGAAPTQPASVTSHSQVTNTTTEGTSVDGPVVPPSAAVDGHLNVTPAVGPSRRASRTAPARRDGSSRGRHVQQRAPAGRGKSSDHPATAVSASSSSSSRLGQGSQQVETPTAVSSAASLNESDILGLLDVLLNGKVDITPELDSSLASGLDQALSEQPTCIDPRVLDTPTQQGRDDVTTATPSSSPSSPRPRHRSPSTPPSPLPSPQDQSTPTDLHHPDDTERVVEKGKDLPRSEPAQTPPQSSSMMVPPPPPLQVTVFKRGRGKAIRYWTKMSEFQLGAYKEHMMPQRAINVPKSPPTSTPTPSSSSGSRAGGKRTRDETGEEGESSAGPEVKKTRTSRSRGAMVQGGMAAAADHQPELEPLNSEPTNRYSSSD